MDNNKQAKQIKELMRQVSADTSLPAASRCQVLAICWQHYCSLTKSSTRQAASQKIIWLEEGDPTYPYLIYDEIERRVLDAAAHGQTAVGLDVGCFSQRAGYTLMRMRYHLEIQCFSPAKKEIIGNEIERFCVLGGFSYVKDELGSHYPRIRWLPYDVKLSDLEPLSVLAAIKAGVAIEDVLA